MLGSYGGRSLHEQSHGESFLSLFERRLAAHSFCILDEPEAALSPSRQLAFLLVLDRLVASGAQFVIATHSPIILAYPRCGIYAADSQGIRPTEYANVECVRVLRSFLDHPARALRELFREGRPE